MKIAYLGSGKFGINCLDALLKSDNDLVLIVTQPPLPAGRGRKEKPTDVAKWARLNNVTFIETANANAPAILAEIALYEPDLIVVIAFGQKMKVPLIKLPPHGSINVHGSLLPKYRGAGPINHAIINGETESGITVSDVVYEMDAGDVLAYAKISIAENETAGQLHDRLAAISPRPLLETIKKIEQDSAVYTPQDNSQATFAPKLTKKDGFIDFKESAQILKQKIMGLWPWPGAAAMYVPQNSKKSTRVNIALAEVIPSSNPDKLTPGTLDTNLNIICGSEALKIIRLQPAGKSLMDFIAFVNGRATKPGDLFTKL